MPTPAADRPAQPEPSGPPVHGAAAEAVEAGDPTTIVIGSRPTSREATASTLQAASRSERVRRATADQPVAVITDDNLAEYAEGANVTVGTAPPPLSDELRGELEERAREERYWRSEALRLRKAWREAHDSLGALEDEAARLRTEFYEADDGFYRDQQIKPAWDRVLDKITEAEETIVQSQLDLEQLMEDGRRAGALPGWLREGIELEPEPPEQTEEGELPSGTVGEPVEIVPP